MLPFMLCLLHVSPLGVSGRYRAGSEYIVYPRAQKMNKLLLANLVLNMLVLVSKQL